MATTPEQALATVRKLEKKLADRQATTRRLDSYYRGDQPLAFATTTFREAFGGLFARFSDNWCSLVTDAVAERLTPIGFRTDDKGPGDAELWRFWQLNDLDADAGLGFIDALNLARSYVMVWGDYDGTPLITFEHPAEAIVGYEPGSRRRRAAALKTWRDEDSATQYATLYLPDSIWKFARAAAAEKLTNTGFIIIGNTDGWRMWQPPGDDSWPLPNPLGQVPIVEMPNRPRLVGDPSSEIATVIPLQDTVNVIWMHLITASEYAAFPQRVIMGMDRPTVPILNDQGEEVGRQAVDLKQFAVNRVAWLEAPEAKIGEWTAANLANYTQVIETAVQHIAAQTRTPPHYLLGQSGAFPSGESLKATETGLVAKVAERQTYFGQTLREVMRLAALVAGDKGKADAVRTGKVLWKDPESRTEGEHVDALLKMQALGVPQEALWERLPDVTPVDIERWKSMQAEAVNRAGVADLAALMTGPKPEPAGPPAPAMTG